MENCFSCLISLVRLDLPACLRFSADMRTYFSVRLVSSVEDLANSLLQVNTRLTRTNGGSDLSAA